jgi:leader peptidase (prepilin peptidase)/N-methyltransferase
MTHPAAETSKARLARPLRRILRNLEIKAMRGKIMLAFVAAVAAFVSIASAPGLIGLLGAGLALLMLAIAVIDWRRFVIPDGLSAAGAALALVHAAALEPEAMLSAAAAAAVRGVALALVFFLVRSAYAKIRGREGLGLGDVKLAFVAGAWLDWLIMPIAIQLAALAALSGYALRHIASGRSMSATHRMPFGSFFAPAVWMCWLLEAAWLSPF